MRVRQWEVASGRLVQVYSNEGDAIQSLVLFPNGQHVATSHYRSSILVRRTDTCEIVRELHAHKKVVAELALSPDGGLLLSGSSDGTVVLWEPVTGKQVRSFEEGYCDAVAISRDGQLAAHAVGGGVIHVWNLGTGETVRRILRHGDAIASVDFSNDSHYLISGDYRGVVQIWEISTGREVAASMPDTPSQVHFVGRISVLPDGRHFIVSSMDGTLRVLELLTAREVYRIVAETHCTRQIAVSPDGRYVASGGGYWLDSDGKQRKDDTFPIVLWQLPQLLWPNGGGKESPAAGTATPQRDTD